MQRELVLNFHGIGTPHPGVSPEESAVWMSRESFVAVLDRISAVRTSARIPIGITFDDGNSSDAAIALPELSKRRLVATFFICAGRLGVSEYLDSQAVRDLLSAGMKIGSHGMHHRNWRNLDETTLAEEVSTARRHLEDVCGKPVNEAAVPFGSYDRRVLTRLRAEEYACVYTSDRGLARSGAWLKPRNTLGGNASLEDVAHLLANSQSPSSILRDAYRFYKGLR